MKICKTNGDGDRTIMYSYILAEFILYVVFTVQDLKNISSNGIKYLSVSVCLVAAFYLLVKNGEKMIFVAMAWTLLADTFLLLLDKYYLIGVLAFCIVQTIYAGRLVLESSAKSIVPRLMLFFITLLMLKVLGVLDMLTAACVWSYTQLLTNVIHAFVIGKKLQGGMLFATGLLLFLACDTCVGINNLLEYVPEFPFQGIIPLASFFMWIFYLPAQVLIVLSFWQQKRDSLKRGKVKI